jgi:TRAP-type C4-dicarboxylate transport system permease small subunit
MKGIAERLGRLAEPVSRWIQFAGALFLFMMMLLLVVHVVGRYVLKLPVPGAVELIELLMSLVVFLGFGTAAVHRANVSVDLFVAQMPKRVQAVIDAATCLLSIGIVALITWQGLVQAWSIWESGHVSGVLHIPYWPFLIILVIGYAVFGLVLLQNFFEYLQEIGKG